MTEIQENFIFKPAEEKDIPLVLNFRNTLFLEMGVPRQSLINNVGEVLFAYYLKEFKADRIRHFIAYDRENTPVAIAGALIKEDFPYFLFKPGFYGWIIDVYTVSEHRRKKLGSKLLELTRQWLVKKGVQEAKLIAAGKDARRLYERLGYRPTWEMSFNLTNNKTYNELIDLRGYGEGI